MQPPVKVMQLVLSLEFGGMEKLVLDLVRRVDKRIIAPVICCFDQVGQFGEELRHEGYPVYVLGRKPGMDWLLVPKLSKLFQQEQVDILHAQQFTPYFYSLLAAGYGKVIRCAKMPKMLYTNHGIPYPYQKKPRRRLINPMLSYLTAEMITISAYTKKNLVTYENFPTSKIRVVYNGIDLQRFSQPLNQGIKKQSLGLPVAAKVIGSVARLDPVKNHAMLLHAFQTVLTHSPDTYLLIIGSGPEAENLQSLSKSLGIAAHTCFLGARRDIPELLHICDVAVLSSFSEGMSVTLLEAMAAGVPVVATNVGGNSEVIQDQETGLLVPNDHIQAMAKALLRLLQDDALRQRLGQAGQQRARTMFSLETMVNCYTEMYRRIAKR